MSIRRTVAALGILAVLLLAAGGVIGATGQYQDEIVGPVERITSTATDLTFGQTFVARRAGLQAIEVYIGRAGPATPSTLELHLRPSPLPGVGDLRVTRQELAANASPGWVRLAFEPLQSARNQSYYAEIVVHAPGDAQLLIGIASAAAYRDGALYLNGRAQDQQLAARLDYGYSGIALDLVAWLATAVAQCVLGIGVFILPGLALQSYLLPLPEENWKTRLGIATGVSMCVYPVLAVWATALGVSPGAGLFWLPLIVSGAGLLWLAIRRRSLPRASVRLCAWWSSALRTPDLLWLAVFAVVVMIRLFVLRGMDAPMWGDSLQHAMISQLIVDKGGLFNSWLPYAPYDSLTVHPGFSLLTAGVMWLTGQTVLSATSLTGQLVNILAILTLTPLAMRLSKSRWAGIGVLVVAGILSPLPNGYANWGRYPQLLGETVAPVAMWLVWRMFDTDRRVSWRLVALSALAFAGTFLAYYRMPHYVAILVLVLLAAVMIRERIVVIKPSEGYTRVSRSWKAPFDRLRLHTLAAVAASVVLAGLLAAPWLLRLKGSALGEGVDAVTVSSNHLADILLDYRGLVQQAPGLLSNGLIVVAIVMVLVVFLTRQKAAMVIAAWGLALLLLPAVRFIPLPGLNNLWVFAVLISLYMPIGLLVGYGLDGMLDGLARNGRAAQYTAIGLMVIAVVLGSSQRLGVLDGDYRILAPADLSAMQWIRDNVPGDAVFLVDGFLVYDGRSAVGSDGGWWLPLLAGRRNSMPPQYPLLAERPIDANTNAWVVNLVTQLRQHELTTREGLAVACRSGITHVYIGEEQGAIGAPPPSPMLSLPRLEQSPAFETIYRQDKVGIFKLKQSTCQ